MVLSFPDLDTLRLAITSGVAPASITLAPAAFATDDAGRLWLQPSTAVPAAVQAALRKLGVQVVKDDIALSLESVCSWPQVLPLQRESENVPVTSQAAVLFDLPAPEQMPELVGEMLRLGNDRQGFRWLEDKSSSRVLLRVVGPPYYSLLRALERDGAAVTPHAFIERSPRVWVEIGYTHPLIEHIQAPKGQLLLMRPARAWTFIDDAPFRDIYEVLELTLPEASIRWREGALDRRLTVPLRLVPGGGTDQAELWVVRQRPLEQLDALVRDSDERLLARLAFAVVPGADGEPGTIVLRARPSKQATPVLVLDADGFRPYLKLPNLYLPCGSRLGPPLRRDAVRKLLADDPALVTWLFPNGNGQFTPESLPDEAFRPLTHWVDYVFDHDRSSLEAWVQSATFDFESFICSDDQPPSEKKKDKGKAKKDKGETPKGAETVEPATEQQAPGPRKGKSMPAKEAFLELPRAEPSALERRLRELEQQFLELKSPLDAVERQDVWRELALLNSALGNADAAVCWTHSFWEDDEPDAARLRTWFEAEAKTRPGDPATRRADGDVAAEIESILAMKKEPTAADLRTLTAGLACAAAEGSLAGPLERIARFLEQHEMLLSVRGVWLAWVSLVQLSSGDILALARARDRLLERLYLSGLNPELDLPGFLRFSGQRSGDRYRAVRDRLVHLHELARLWCETEKIEDPYNNPRDHHTLAYIDLMFAFALARIGEIAASDRLVNQAQQTLENLDDVHSLLLEAFAFRISQAKEGKPNTGSLPAALIERLGTMRLNEQKRKREQKDQSGSMSYKVEKLREASWILEPHEKVDAIRVTLSPSDNLCSFSTKTDRDEIMKDIRRLLEHEKSPEKRITILSAALRIGSRLGDALATELLQKTASLLNDLADERSKPQTSPRGAEQYDPHFLLLERGIFVAAHYDHIDLVRSLAQRFVDVFESLYKTQWTSRLNVLVHQCFAGLRKFGLRDEMDRLLQQLAGIITQGQDLPVVRERLQQRWASALSTLLHIAGVWFYFGRNDRALAVLDTARMELFKSEGLLQQDKNRLAVAYCKCLWFAPPEMALGRIEEMFRRLGQIQDHFVTNTNYSLSRLLLIEAVVLAVVSDDFTLGSEVRRWLEDDEFLVRRRIHRDVKAAMAQAGM